MVVSAVGLIPKPIEKKLQILNLNKYNMYSDWQTTVKINNCGIVKQNQKVLYKIKYLGIIVNTALKFSEYVY